MQSETYRAHIRWLQLRGLSEQTIYQRAGNLRRFAAYHGGRPLASLTEADVINWAESLAGLAIATRAVYISHVRSFYAWAYAEHRIPADPAASLPAPKVSQGTPRPISEDQLNFAVSTADGRIRAWLVLAAWCGLRAKEIALLRAENIRLNDIPPYLIVAADATKGHRERVIALCDFAVRELRRQPLPSRGLCWKTFDGRPVAPNLVSQVSNRYLHDNGIQDTLHQLRHRFGTQVQRAVRDVFVTQQLLGHSSPATTAVYAQVADADKLRAVNSIPVPAAPAENWDSQWATGLTIP